MNLVVLLALTRIAATAPDESPIDVRIGIVAYQDSRADVERFRDQLAELAAASSRPIRARFALGTYGDVRHWMERQYIDVAVMSPGVFAETLDTAPTRPDWRYMATMGLRPAESPLASEARRAPGYHYEYAAVCVVASDSALRSTADLRRAAEAGRVRFLFVHPMSVSGRIAPEFALRQIGIRPRPEHIEYTHSHSNSLRLISEPRGELEQVAFVWDDPPQLSADRAARVRKLDFPELERLHVPQNAIAARSDYEHAEFMTSLLTQHIDGDGRHDFQHFDDWSERYGVIQRWIDAIELPAEPADVQNVSLDELGRILVHYVRSQPGPPRVALVLSGGGAKCAFQVGAVAAIEEKLAELRESEGDAAFDLGLVVGTSGGAINALPIALGISATPEGRAGIRQVWQSLDQQDIVQPPDLVRWNIGVWLVAIQATVIFWALRRFVATPIRRGWIGPVLILVLAVPHFAIGYIRWTPWRLLGTNHLWHHLWLWGTFGARWAGWCMLVIGVVSLAAQWWLRRRQSHIALPAGVVRWALVIALIGLPGVQLAMVLFYESTLTDGSGMELAVADKLPPLIETHAAPRSASRLDAAAASAAERLRHESARIIRGGLLRRDLVLTGSCLSKTAAGLPSDLYFYAAADPARPAPQFGKLGVSFADHPDLLLDVMLGSGSIYPVFPARTLRDFPRAGESVDLVDGGFAHNSPIEAAVLWGATHVILIEASPSGAVREGRRNFLENSIDAFNHLYYQAQLADARSKEKVVIFTLRPQPPHICVLDFASNLIEQAIDRGYREARGELRGGDRHVRDAPSFQKELGEPLFVGGTDGK